MPTVARLPVREMFLDARGTARGLRVTSHSDQGLVVLSIWQDDRCTASFQLPIADSSRLIAMLAGSLGEHLAAAVADGPTAGYCSTACGEACCSARRACSG